MSEWDRDMMIQAYSNKIEVSLRYVEEHFEDTWKIYGIVDLYLGTVTFDWNDYQKLILKPLSMNPVIPILAGGYSPWDGMPDSPKDDKTELVDSTGKPLKTQCNWPSYKDYLGLSESFKYCEKCGKKESDHG